MYKIMTPGPTQVAENVRLARSLECTNPDLDEDFVEFYKETCEKISALLHTSNETLILSGEGILGLEAAIASMTEPGDKVLVLDNGIYGKGFADFVSMYGGKPELYTRDYQNTFDIKELENFLVDNHDYKYATVVHGDTPSGMLNNVAAICPLLKKYGILTVVDSVSASFGEPLSIDACQIDIMCGGSQKVVSAPPGLTFVVVSDREIEEFLYKLEGVKDVQVAGIPSKKYGEEVGAFIILKEGADIHESDVRDFCTGKISRYKIPKYVFFIDEFPMTGSGKIQKFKLKDVGLQLCKEQGIEII